MTANQQTDSTEAVNAREIVGELVRKARKAMNIFIHYDQSQVDEVVQALAWAICKPGNAEELARVAVRDTGLGKYEDKVNKNRRKTMGTLRDLLGAKSVGVIHVDEEKGITEIAKPVGVVAAVVPSTNPAATPLNKAMMALKGRNAIIFSPSPKGATTCQLLIQYIHEELAKIGAPLDLVQSLPAPVNKELSNELIQQCDIVTVTGSANNVRAGQTSGKPNLCVSAGNVVSVVDATANLQEAAHRICLSKIYDYATSCSSDNAVVIEEAVYDEMIGALKKEGGYLCSAEEKALLEQAMWPDGKRSGKTTAKAPEVIAEAAGLQNPAAKEASFFMVEETGIGPGYPFSREKLAVVLAVYKAKDFDDALDITKRILNCQGRGHSCGLHTTDESHIERIGLEMDVCRLLINQAQCYGNGGNFNNGLNFTLSMGGGTWAGNNIGENLSYKHFINITKVSRVIPEVIPTEEDLWGSYFAKYGR
ncbi:acylating sulfoacetaldehyde dehydrogenase [Ferviditalea candida]|uniref:Aldehyde dehydrogenase family protein n=1 Tax=Ferviditalea candida TaxID=3108399 RepID=A0ABU5ZEM9_9BACL|nr:aldehyde dehydrogenase family protein [Paenibacillaceae bacterium T2]